MAEQEEVRTDTATLITTLRSIAECDPAYRDIATQAADRMETLWSLTRALLKAETEQDRIIAERDAARKINAELLTACEANRDMFRLGGDAAIALDRGDREAHDTAANRARAISRQMHTAIDKARDALNGGTHD